MHITKAVATGFVLVILAVCSVESLQENFQRRYTELFRSDTRSSPSINLPDLSSISEACPRNALFQSLNPKHKVAVNGILQILKATDSTSDLLDVADALHQSPDINPKAWYYAITSFVHNDPHLQYISKPSPAEVMADNFIYSAVLEKARKQASRKTRVNEECVILDETFGADNGVENKLWYFREDIMINAHHWYYHIAHPDWRVGKPREDRRGELFYYLHHGLLARYNSERFSNGLSRVIPYNWYEGTLLDEGYNPHLLEDTSNSNWTARAPFTPLKVQSKVNNAGSCLDFDVNNTVIITKRILEAIEKHFAIATNKSYIPLYSSEGIDILVDIVESNQFSINGGLYGNLHNSGHGIVAGSADPTGSKRLPPGVMADTTVAMRDIAFYRWHTNIDNIFKKQKDLLLPYSPTTGDFPLLWHGVQLVGINIRREAMLDENEIILGNELRTFWRTRSLSLSIGLDLRRDRARTPAKLCVKHLDHVKFQYQFTINKTSSVGTSRATVRIFMAPRFKETGTRFSIEDQAHFFFPLDIFTTEIHDGTNIIVRNSTDSTLTIPWHNSFEELEGDVLTQTPFCGCGFPHHLLLPKGTTEGMIFDIFVMLTNGDEDEVLETPPLNVTNGCRAAPLYCGIVDRKYPDSKPMNYPFDRLPYVSNNGYFKNSGRHVVELDRKLATLDKFVSGIPNMATVQVRVSHDDVTYAI